MEKSLTSRSISQSILSLKISVCAGPFNHHKSCDALNPPLPSLPKNHTKPLPSTHPTLKTHTHRTKLSSPSSIERMKARTTHHMNPRTRILSGL
ncbi:hypothetical protein K470DRAFT_254869 [Piedraia hortae CBS 480.64]|uniref:Uncharacterized protein n=1 Tax=Piedraia hortae CBS 480.64 TaxID=1314780 RepID=A0A6A7C919_9PEZI|nr:hypothetical protein K470DRAFT_254869 [Piedraia hortae CBS 480.64]